MCGRHAFAAAPRHGSSRHRRRPPVEHQFGQRPRGVVRGQAPPPRPGAGSTASSSKPSMLDAGSSSRSAAMPAGTAGSRPSSRQPPPSRRCAPTVAPSTSRRPSSTPARRRRSPAPARERGLVAADQQGGAGHRQRLQPRHAGQAPPKASATSTSSVMPRPSPPCASGRCRPSAPCSASCRHSARSKPSPLESHPAHRGRVALAREHLPDGVGHLALLVGQHEVGRLRCHTPSAAAGLFDQSIDDGTEFRGLPACALVDDRPRVPAFGHRQLAALGFEAAAGHVRRPRAAQPDDDGGDVHRVPRRRSRSRASSPGRASRPRSSTCVPPAPGS